MKYTSILLSLLATTTISCGYIQQEGDAPADSTAVDSVKIDSVDSRSESIDTVKKKTVSNPYTSKWRDCKKHRRCY